MNEVLRTLFERKSVRVYEEKPIAEADRNLIIDSALQAPTAGNQILYAILDIEDQKLKNELADSCDHQPFIAAAPLVLVFLADTRRWLDCYREAGTECREPGLGDIQLAIVDAVIAAQNSVIAAESLGIGSCYIGDIMENRERVMELLKLDPYTVPAAMVVYGYPTAQQKEREKPRRFERQFIVHKNTYEALPGRTLREMHARQSGRADFDFDAAVKAFCKRKYMSDFSKEMTRSVSEYLKVFVNPERMEKR